jgi:hypothetical protein
MFFYKISLAVLITASCIHAEVDLLTDISKISRSWGQVSVYADNDENYFGVEYVGLPDGCQVVSPLISRLQF